MIVNQKSTQVMAQNQVVSSSSHISMHLKTNPPQQTRSGSQNTRFNESLQNYKGHDTAKKMILMPP